MTDTASVEKTVKNLDIKRLLEQLCNSHGEIGSSAEEVPEYETKVHAIATQVLNAIDRAECELLQWLENRDDVYSVTEALWDDDDDEEEEDYLP